MENLAKAQVAIFGLQQVDKEIDNYLTRKESILADIWKDIEFLENLEIQKHQE